MVVEDLHWLDPSTLELEQLLAEQGVTVPLMLICTARPEFHAPWPMRSHHTQIRLNRLSARNVREMVALGAARNALPSESVEAVIERTGGVPLFVEELTRAVLESGAVKLSAREIPVTLHDSLMARLDRLGSAKDVLQIASVIGSDFSYELLHAVHPTSEQELETELRKLTDADLLYFRGLAPDATYQFKHALIRDAAYEALLKSRRKELHRLVACTIDEQFPDMKEAHPEVLARHWTEAGEIEPAIAEWSRAGKAAEARNAFREAQESYEQALALFNFTSESIERYPRELELRQSLVSIFNVTKGYAAPETITAVESAIALAEKSRDLNRLVNFLTWRGSTLLVSGDLVGANASLDRALELAIGQASSTNLAFIHQQQLIVRFWRGDLNGAEQHFSAWLTLFNDREANQPVPGTPLNLAVNAFAFGSFTAWILGRPELARVRESQMFATANEGGPFEIANSGYLSLARYLREYERVEALAMRAIELAEKHHLPNPAARSRTMLGLAQAHLGRPREGVALIRQGIAGLHEIGTRMGITLTMACLADAQGLAGSIAAALESVEIALKAAPDELAVRPEILRLRGELRLQQGELQLAEADFRDSIALARSMGAKAWELRTTMSLARLLASKGPRDEPRAMLAEIYNWFTEGFDTVDLKEAKALLEELGGTGARAT
jgi:tetratricopeptide (TPR) repeat protein